LKKYTLL